MNATSNWRDLADQLTAEQVAELAHLEATGQPPGQADPREGYIRLARSMAQQNIVNQMCVDLPAPAGAVEMFDWMEWDDGEYRRQFTVSKTRLHGVVVELGGTQHSDGRVEHCIVIADDAEEDIGLTADQARAVAQVLLAAAGELDRVSDSAP